MYKYLPSIEFCVFVFVIIYSIGFVVKWAVLMDKSEYQWDWEQSRFRQYYMKSGLTRQDIIHITLWPLFVFKTMFSVLYI